MTAYAERVRVWVLCLGFGVFVPLGLLAKQSMATSFIAIAVLLILTSAVVRPRALLPARSVAWSFAAFCLYVGATHLLVISCEPCLVKSTGKLAMLGLILWLACSGVVEIDPPDRRKAAIALIIGIGAALLLVMIELSSESMIYRALTGRQEDPDVPLFRYNRGTSALVLLAWPAAAWLWLARRRSWAAILIALSIGAAIQSDSGSAMVASVLALLTAGAAVLAPSPTFWFGVLATGGFALMAPLLFLFLLDWAAPISAGIPPSTLDRLEIWHRAATATLDAPWLGHGIGVIRHLPLPPELADRYVHLVKPPTHPHDAAIQIWLELGAVGMALFAVLLWFAIRPVRALPPVWRVAALGTGAAMVFTALVSYGFWQETWLGIIGMTVLAFRVLAREGDSL